MIDAFAIENEGRIIEKHTVSGANAKRVDKLIKGIQDKGNLQSKLISTMVNAELTAYYFIQDSFKFILVTQESTLKEARIKKYLNIIAEMFYEQYDQKSFGKILEYSMDEINKAESSVADSNSEITINDQHDILLISTVAESKAKMRQKLRMRPRGRRATVITTLLLLAIMSLVFLYYFRHI